MHTHMEETEIGYTVRQLLMFLGVEPRCKVFHYISIKLHGGLK